MSRARTAIALVALLLATGCTGGDSTDSTDGSDLRATNGSGDPDEIRADLAALFAGDHPEQRELDAGRCFAEAFTAATTPAELRDGGVLDASYDVVDPLPSLPADLAATWVEAQFGCTDFVEESTRAQVKVSKGRIDAEGYAACLADSLTEEQMRAAVQATLEARWDAAELRGLSDAQTVCYAEAMPPDPS